MSQKTVTVKMLRPYHYDIIFFDADETLFNFKKTERSALIETLQSRGLPTDEEILEGYSALNKSLWLQLERGELDQPTLQEIRFPRFFEKYGFDADGVQANHDYLEAIANYSFLLPGALELVEALYPHRPLYITTNGLPRIQKSRLAKSPIRPYIREMFISGELGAAKPSPLYFDKVFEKLAEQGIRPERKRCLLLGDSLTSDMKGGRAAGIDTCYYDPAHKGGDSSLFDYHIDTLSDFIPIALG